MTKEEKTDVLLLKMLNDSVLHIEYLVETIDAAAAEKALEIRLNFTKHAEVKMLVDVGSVKKFTKDARDIMGSPRGYDKIAASAIILKSPLQAMLGNFYMRFSSQPVPTKLVSSYEDGLKWLQSLDV